MATISQTGSSLLAQDLDDIRGSSYMEIELPSTSSVSYCDKLLSMVSSYIPISKFYTPLNIFSEITTPNLNILFIPLASEGKACLYQPWKQSVIIKVGERKLGYRYLLNRLQAI